MAVFRRLIAEISVRFLFMMFMVVNEAICSIESERIAMRLNNGFMRNICFLFVIRRTLYAPTLYYSIRISLAFAFFHSIISNINTTVPLIYTIVFERKL